MPINIGFAGHADDNTPYTNSSKLKIFNWNNRQGALEKMLHLFSTNHLVASAGKCHLLTSSKTPIDTHISNVLILTLDLILIFT